MYCSSSRANSSEGLDTTVHIPYSWADDSSKRRHRIDASLLCETGAPSPGPSANAPRATGPSHRSPDIRDRARHGTTDVDRTAFVLEAAAVALAASVIGADDIAAARELNGRLLATTPHDDTARPIARAFHRALITACPNGYLVGVLDDELARASRPGHVRRASPADVRHVAGEHARILRLVERRASGIDIERALLDHLGSSPLCHGMII